MGSSSAIRHVLGSVTALSAAFLVEHRGVLSLIDTGSRGCGRRILAAIRATGRRPEDVRQIVLTHCHGDHTGEAGRLRELTGATIVAGAADVPVIEGTGDYPAPKDPLSRALFKSLERFARVAVDRPIGGREELEGGLVAIPAPGTRSATSRCSLRTCRPSSSATRSGTSARSAPRGDGSPSIPTATSSR